MGNNGTNGKDQPPAVFSYGNSNCNNGTFTCQSQTNLPCQRLPRIWQAHSSAAPCQSGAELPPALAGEADGPGCGQLLYKTPPPTPYGVGDKLKQVCSSSLLLLRRVPWTVRANRTSMGGYSVTCSGALRLIKGRT